MKTTASHKFYRLNFILLLFLTIFLSACSQSDIAGIPEENLELQSVKRQIESTVVALETPHEIVSNLPPAQGISQGLPLATEDQDDATESLQEPTDEISPANQTPTPWPTDTSIPIEENLLPIDASVGNLAPDFNLETLAGDTVQLSSLKGKYVIINYWASWCIPCSRELSILESYQQEAQQENLVILTVNGIEQDKLEDVNELVSELNLSLTVVLDKESTIWSSYKVLFLPTTYFIDTAGVIRYIKLGEFTESDFLEIKAKLLNDQL